MPDRSLAEQLDQAIDALLGGAQERGAADSSLSGWMEITGKLRDIPDERFKARLGRELQGVPDTVGFAIHTITPFICVPDGDELIEFMKGTFDADETSREPHRG